MASTVNFTKIFDIADAFQSSAILFFANKEKLFDLLDSNKTVEQIAIEKKWLIWKTRILLDSLVALGVLNKDNSRYINSPAASAFLVTGKKTYQGDVVEHERLQWTLWNSLDKIMTTESATGEQQDIRFVQENHDNNVFHNAMKQLADELADYVVEIEGWNTKKKVIDLAGGHGLYLAKLAIKFPQLAGEIWDLPSAKQSANNLINEFGLASKLQFIEKDIIEEASYRNQKCDGILINHCLHHFQPEQVSAFLKSCSEMLEKDGIIAMVESHLKPDLTSPPSNALFSMYMMVNRQYGQVHSTEWIAKELSSFGLSVEVKEMNNPGEDALIVARK